MSSADVRAGRVLFLKNYITEEDLSSQITGSETEFTFLNNFVGGTVRVFLNGLREKKDASYIEVAPNKIQFTIALDVDDDLIVDYIKK